MMRTAACGLLMCVVSCAVANAQTYNDLQIRMGPYAVSPDGGEKPENIWRSSIVAIGQPVYSTFSFGATCDAWAVSSQTELREDATTAWRIETTPIRVDGNAVTFRLRWGRAAGLRQQLEELSRAFSRYRTKVDGKIIDTRKAMDSGVPGADITLTLRPGESYPVDSIPVPQGAKTVHGKACGSSASIRIAVDHYPSPEDERRLVVADLWLVERLADGTEAQRSQPLNVRGLPNRPFRFYFDSLVDGKATLDVYGILTATPGSNAMAVNVETRSRWAPEMRNIGGPQQFFTSKVQLEPSETVEIRLPPIDEGPFAKRTLSIRIRARQLR